MRVMAYAWVPYGGLAPGPRIVWALSLNEATMVYWAEFRAALMRQMSGSI